MPLYKNVKILKLSDIYHIELAKFMHKCPHGELPIIYNEYFQQACCVHSHEISFASVETYFIQRISSNSRKNSIS